MGNVLLQIFGSCHSCNITLTLTTYLSIVAGQIPSFIEIVSPDGTGLFQQNNEPCHTAKSVEEWF